MPRRFRLFEAFGVELEYMIVDRDSLRVMPVCDRLLCDVAGQPGAQAEFEDGSNVPTEVVLGPISWSNELVAHVVEFKTTDPAPTLSDLPSLFQQSVTRANALLSRHNAILLPAAMHPTMDPFREMRLWTHGYNEVYETFNRIFDCRGHGWANLQASHLNLPFDGDDEFGRLHGALRGLLPLMPALAASSPVMDGRVTGLLDNRMEVYRGNSRRVPSIAGRIVPEPVFTGGAYRREILQRIYDDLAPMDPEGVLRDEWCNSRGCIARFSRGSIEVRVLDVQECPAADLAIGAAIVAAARAIATGRLGSLEQLASLDTPRLESILLAVIRDAEQTPISDAGYLAALGIQGLGVQGTAGDVWRHLIDRTLALSPEYPGWRPALDTITSRGTLSRRLCRALGPNPGAERIAQVYRDLAGALAEGRLFDDARAIP